MARKLLFAVFLLLGSLASAQTDQAPAKVTIQPLKVGSALRYSVKVDLEVGGANANLSTFILRTLTKSDAEVSETEIAWEKLAISVEGEELPLPEPAKLIVKSKPSGELTSVTGGIEGADMARMFVALNSFLPVAALAPAETYVVEFKAKDTALPTGTLKGTYIGPDKVGDKPAHKFETKFREAASGGMTCDVTFWVQEDGTILKLTSKFAAMPIPQAGSTADGTATVTFAPNKSE